MITLIFLIFVFAKFGVPWWIWIMWFLVEVIDGLMS